MKTKSTMALRRLALCAVPLVLMSGLVTAPARALDATAAVPATAQTQTQTEAQLPEGQIEQLVAPIALYPDPLLTQVLMASTYPLEVIEAARWSQANSTVNGQALQDAMQAQSWDPSVKALTAVPQTLQMMNAKLDWTQQLGDAFLAQQQDVLNAVQKLRAQAQAAGNLQSTPQQVVTTEAPAAGAAVSGPPPIVIEPVNPDVYYVPVYNPAVTYGAWSYPDYPPFNWSPPGFVASNVVSFAAGVAVGSAIWGGCNWWQNHVTINVNRFNVFNHTNINIANNNWIHNPEHRHGVPYQNASVARRFDAANGAAVRNAFRDRADTAHNDMFGDRADTEHNDVLRDRTDVQRPDVAHDMARDGGADSRRIAPAEPDRFDGGGDRRVDRAMPERQDPARPDFARPREDARPQAMRSRAQMFRPGGRAMGGGFHGFGGGGRRRL
jgi:Protein of unknown function (DUF3300)